MLETAQILLLGVHLLAVNVASAGPLLCPLLQWWEASGGNACSGRVGRQLAGWSLAGFFLGGLTGLLQGWLIWVAGGDRFFTALSRMPSKVYFGVWELVFYVVCLLVYILWWRFAPPRGVPARLFHGLFAWAAATNLLWHFPPLLTLAAHLAVVEPTGPVIDAAAFRELIFAPLIMSRCVHIWLASLATSGIVVAALSLRQGKEQADAARLVACGGRIALVATLLQIPVGTWVLFSSGTLQQSRMLGGEFWATATLVVSVLAALGLLHQLAAISMPSFERANVMWAMILLLLTVFTMSATLLLARGDAMWRPVREAKFSGATNLAHASSFSRIWQ